MFDDLVVHVADRSSRARAEQSRVLLAIGCHAEIYEGLEELQHRVPDRGIVLCRQDDKSDAVARLVELLDHTGVWLPIIATARDPSPALIVRAMKAGATSFLSLPLQPEEVAVTLRDVLNEVEKNGKERNRSVEARHRIRALSGRERDVLDLLTDGFSNKDIAQRLAISPRTVEIHRAHMMQKLGAKHVAHAIHCRLVAAQTGDHASSYPDRIMPCRLS